MFVLKAAGLGGCVLFCCVKSKFFEIYAIDTYKKLMSEYGVLMSKHDPSKKFRPTQSTKPVNDSQLK
jgi:hypothetical protein